MQKIIKSYMMAIVAVMLVIGFSAFKVVESHNNMLLPQYRWYELIETNSTDPSQQMLVSGTPISPPPETSAEDCAKTENNGDFCAVLIEFEPGTSSFILEDTDVANAIDLHDTAVRIATNVEAHDDDEDGYAKQGAQKL